MGEAKRRGTYEDRRRLAIAKRIETERVTAQQPNPMRGITANILLAALAAGWLSDVKPDRKRSRRSARKE